LRCRHNWLILFGMWVTVEVHSSAIWFKDKL